MRTSGDNEYQHPTSVGSLASASRCWVSLRAAGVDHQPHHFTFIYHCPTPADAAALAASLRSHPFGVVVTDDRDGGVSVGWHIRGATRQQVQSLGSLERLFTALRRMASRHAARLTGLTVAAARAG